MSIDLLTGVTRFRSEIYPGLEGLFGELAQGQTPEVLLVTCADSRIDPSLITQTRPGELFVSRNAGNVVPPVGAVVGGVGSVATVEYAVKVLNVREVIVCGHSDCGAVKAARATETLGGLPAVEAWLQLVGTGGDPTADLDHAVGANVLLQLEHLMSYSYIADAVDAGHLRLRGWTYDIGSGEVREWSGSAFVPL